MSNAMAYGDPTRDVTVSSLVKEGTARLAVHNFGNAIPADMLTAVFEPMVRGETPGSAQRNVGLGLFIVKAIAAAHEGRVEVTSSVEDGTIFAVSFPALPGA
ncbi:sensor histidine kinase [Roseateles chitinivorans]|uniref:sensor histidine kinase n=1 Tax=Roseateles chitinivorans TaxID=2917965 RepID=UPI003D6763AC